MADSFVRLVDVSHAYGRSGLANDHVLRNINLEIAAGEFVAIRGRSGSGKSTLLNIVGGILPPTGGDVVVGGRQLFRLDDRGLSEFRGRTIGFVFQSYHLAPPLTALENVMVPALLAGMSTAKARKAALARLDEVGLADKIATRPAELSGGQMQRVALARALVNDPAILLADEPTGNLDEQTGREILSLLGRDHREQGLTVIMATHDESVAQYATRWYRLEGGNLTQLDKAAADAPTPDDEGDA